MGSRGERHLAEYLRGALKRQTFLPRLGFTYRGFEDYVLDRGCPYGSSSPLTPEELNAVLSVAGGRRWRIKECFHNAQMLAAMDISGRLKYVEGYAIGHLVPVLHAWVSVNGKVVDLTWRLESRRRGSFGDRILGVIPEDRAYYGVEFGDTDLIRKRILSTGFANPMIDDWQAGYPLLRQPRHKSTGG